MSSRIRSMIKLFLPIVLSQLLKMFMQKATSMYCKQNQAFCWFRILNYLHWCKYAMLFVPSSPVQCIMYVLILNLCSFLLGTEEFAIEFLKCFVLSLNVWIVISKNRTTTVAWTSTFSLNTCLKNMNLSTQINQNTRLIYGSI